MRKQEQSSKAGMIMVIFITFIMITSVIGFLWGGEEGARKYRGVKFTASQRQWIASFNGKQYSFDVLPQEIEFIAMEQDIISALRNKPEIDITSDVNDTYAEEIALAEYSLGINLLNNDIFMRQGFLTENEFNAPVITCQDATKDVPVILLKKSNSTKASIKDDCITLEIKNGIDASLIKDRIAYSILGIMD